MGKVHTDNTDMVLVLIMHQLPNLLQTEDRNQIQSLDGQNRNLDDRNQNLGDQIQSLGQ